MPVMAVCAVLVLVRVLTLGTPDPAHPDQNVVNGLGFLWNPKLSELGDFETWLAAAGQIFFSLSVGFGVIINYASYLRRKQDVVLSSLTASATNELFEVGFGGLITVTAAFVFLGASGAVGGTFGLGFNTLPVVFLHMGALGRIVGLVWFLMLFLAAITSSLSMLQPVTAFAQEALGMPRSRAVVGIGILATLGSFWVLYFSGDLLALDTIDFWVGTLCLPILALVQVVLFGWVLGVDRGLAEAGRGAEIRIPRIYRWVIKYVSPTFLLIVLGGFCVQNLPDRLRGLAENTVARNSVLLLVALAAFLCVIVWRAAPRWRGKERAPSATTHAWGDP
jgi:SNF family Na+-dependent transporter